MKKGSTALRAPLFERSMAASLFAALLCFWQLDEASAFGIDLAVASRGCSACLRPCRLSNRSPLRFHLNAVNDSTDDDDDDDDGSNDDEDNNNDGIPEKENAAVNDLKEQIFNVAENTKRGFQATQQQRKQMRTLVEEIRAFNPSSEPASPYYSKSDDDNTTPPPEPTLAGKWTLIYTDAPDITGLDTSPFAKLGRIGQECAAPDIKNVIEWKRPDIAARLNLPFSGDSESRILQKVVTSGKADPGKPYNVDLDIAGIELCADGDDDSLQNQGLPATLIKQLATGGGNAVELKGGLTLPFGKFEILYLDGDMRIIKTYQNYLAVSERIENKEDEWF